MSKQRDAESKWSGEKPILGWRGDTGVVRFAGCELEVHRPSALGAVGLPPRASGIAIKHPWHGPVASLGRWATCPTLER